jgi:hypothetical protein
VMLPVHDLHRCPQNSELSTDHPRVCSIARPAASVVGTPARGRSRRPALQP